jgi:hypothetical protein
MPHPACWEDHRGCLNPGFTALLARRSYVTGIWLDDLRAQVSIRSDVGRVEQPNAASGGIGSARASRRNVVAARRQDVAAVDRAALVRRRRRAVQGRRGAHQTSYGIQY